MNNFELDGFKEVENALKKLPEAMRVKTLLKAERKAAKPLIKAARNRVPTSKVKRVEWWGKKRTILPGVLKKSIGMIANRKGRYPSINVGPRTSKGKRKSKWDAWWAHFVEFGTNGFTIGKGKKAGRFIAGQAAQPFMRPAYDETKDKIPEIMADELGKEVMKIFNKTIKK